MVHATTSNSASQANGTSHSNGTTRSSTDLIKDLLVITCASGKQASAILPHLTPKFKNLRLICHSPNSAESLSKAYPTAEIVQTDFNDPSAAALILRDATTIYQVEPPFAHLQTSIGIRVIDAAIAELKRPGSRLKHFVYASVLNTELGKMLHHDSRRQTTEYLLESPLPYTILQPTHFMFLLPLGPLLAQSKPVYHANWNPAVPFSFLALSDLGEIAAKVILEREEHLFALYPLCSTLPISYTEIIEIVEEESGKQIEVKTKSVEEAVQGFLLRVLGGQAVESDQQDAVERMLLYYNRHGLVGSPNVCRWLLDREPTSWRKWIRRELGKS